MSSNKWSSKDLELFKATILEKKQKALEDLGDMKERTDNLIDQSSANSIYSSHMADAGSDHQEMENAYYMMQREDSFIKYLDKALGMIEDGTAIGMGLATAVNRLRESDAKSRVVILLTDGFNTQGSIPPLTAAEIAREFGVRVYTIGVGTLGKAPYPFKTSFGTTAYQNVEVKIDEPTMKEIAKMTGGKYFRATNNRSLAAVYEEIDQLEKSKIEVTEYRRKKEEFFPFALIAGILLLMEFILKHTFYRTIN